MLVLTRRVGEEIVIADQVRVRVVSLRGRRVRLAITAPESIPVHRAEACSKRIAAELAEATTSKGVQDPA